MDIAKHQRDIERLVRARFSRVFARRRWEMEDFVQDVAFSIWRRNKTDGAYDPARSKLSTYVLLVATSMFRNRLRDEARRVRPILDNDAGAASLDPANVDPIAIIAAKEKASKRSLFLGLALADLLDAPDAPASPATPKGQHQHRRRKVTRDDHTLDLFGSAQVGPDHRG